MKTKGNEFEAFGVAFAEPWATLIIIGAILILGGIALRIILALTRRWLTRSDRVDDMLNTFIVNVVKVAGIIVLIAMVLDALGVGIGTIVAVLGAAGAAIALALKDSLSNVAGGVMIIINKPFRQGDLINVGEFRGRVVSIDLFLTTLRTLNYQTITIPNGLINTSILVNESWEERRRVDLQFTISYEEDIARVKEILMEVCRGSEMILKDPEPGIGPILHDERGVVLEVLAWCGTDDYFSVGYYLNEEVRNAFAREGIAVPAPRRDVRVNEPGNGRVQEPAQDPASGRTRERTQDHEADGRQE